MVYVGFSWKVFGMTFEENVSWFPSFPQSIDFLCFSVFTQKFSKNNIWIVNVDYIKVVVVPISYQFSQ